MGPRPSLFTALPLSVWQEHITPLLSVTMMTRLRRVCKALRGVVSQCPVKLGGWSIDNPELEEALTCFPAAESLELIGWGDLDDPEAVEVSRLVELLRRHGGALKRVTWEGEHAERVVLSAVNAGALPRLSFFSLRLWEPLHQEALSHQRLTLVEEVDVRGFDGDDEMEALAHVLHLPHLRRLELTYEDGHEEVLPPFIPPSLKSLTLKLAHDQLLCNLPAMLQSSGARLEEISLLRCEYLPDDECGAALARVLRKCAPTLKSLSLVHGYQDQACIREYLPSLVEC
jgi:hypothetical protein